MNQLNDLVVGGHALYRQIEKILRARIAGGQYKPGAPFPTDARLCEEFKVSRSTVRIALEALQREGLIVRHARRGSFVSERPNQATTLRFNGSIEQIVTQGDGAGTAHHIERCRLVRPSKLEAQELRLEDQQALRLEGFRTREGIRIGHMQISIPEELGKRMNIREGHDYPSIFGMFETKLGMKVQRVRQIISVQMPSKELAQALEISPKVPLLVRQRTFMGVNDIPLELAIASYPSDRYRYEIVIS